MRRCPIHLPGQCVTSNTHISILQGRLPRTSQYHRLVRGEAVRIWLRTCVSALCRARVPSHLTPLRPTRLPARACAASRIAGVAAVTKARLNSSADHPLVWYKDKAEQERSTARDPAPQQPANPGPTRTHRTCRPSFGACLPGWCPVVHTIITMPHPPASMGATMGATSPHRLPT